MEERLGAGSVSPAWHGPAWHGPAWLGPMTHRLGLLLAAVLVVLGTGLLTLVGWVGAVAFYAAGTATLTLTLLLLARRP